MMNITFNNSEVLSDEQILVIENEISKSLPIKLIDFFKKYSNSIPTINGKPCSFQTIHSDGWTQSNFIERITSVANIISEISDRDTLNLYISEFELSSDFVEIEYLLPFASAAIGMLYYSIGGIHEGKIYFADNGDFGILFQDKSFESFWDAVFEHTITNLK